MSEKQQRRRNPLFKRNRLPMFDIPFFVGIMALLFAGLAFLYSAGFADALSRHGNSYYYIRKQLLFACAGFITMMLVSFISYKWYRRFVWLAYLVANILLVVVLFFGSSKQHRWINLGGISFQPSEFAKVIVVVTLADYLSRNQGQIKKFLPGVLVPCLIWGIPCGLVAIETHLSGAILIASIGVIMMFCAGCRILHMVLPGIACAGLGGILVATTDYMSDRINTWLHPETVDKLNEGWQVYQSFVTIGSGGAFGLGYARSRQKYYFMSEPQNDFIFSVVCEEGGFFLAVFVILLFAFFICRGIYIARHAPNTFSSLVVIGIVGKVAVQIIFNTFVVTGLVPVTGIPLPFFSFGGTALFVLLAEMGLVLYISRFITVEKGSEKHKNKKTEREAMTSPVSSEA